MGLFGRSTTTNEKQDSISTAEWQSIASGNEEPRQSLRNDESGFAPPNAPMQSSWAKERHAQQMELDGHTSTEVGCCSRFCGWAVKSLHVFDVILGTTLIVYGSLIRTQFTPPAMAAVTFCLLFGSILFLSSTLGIYSYFSTKCKRFGLLISGYVAPYLCVVYITMIVALGMDSSGFLTYLEEHYSVMYFGEGVDENVERLLPLIYGVLGILAVLELVRTFVTLDTRNALLAASSNGYGYTSLSSPPENLKEPLLDSKRKPSSHAPSVAETEEKEVAETPDWWEG